MTKPHIPICIPVYQGTSTLVATLRSVPASARADFGVMIRDDSSTDDTSDVIAGFDNPRIWLIRPEETLPLPANWRATVKQARGKLIKVVCADDFIYPDCLAAQATFLEDLSPTPVVCRRDSIDGNSRILTRNTGLPGLLGRRGVSEAARAMMQFGINPVSEPACVMFRRKDYDTIGGLNGLNVFVMGIDAWPQTLTRGDISGQLEVHVVFCIWTESFSNNHNRQQLDDHFRFLKWAANNPCYKIPAVLRHLVSAAAHASWRAWTARQRLWNRRSTAKARLNRSCPL